MKTKQSIPTKLHSRVLVEGIAVSIYTAAEEFLVRYRDGKQRFSRTFERLDQAQAFARFLARRQHWLAAAQELGAGHRTPVMPGFFVGPATVNTEAVEQFQSAARTSWPTRRAPDHPLGQVASPIRGHRRFGDNAQEDLGDRREPHLERAHPDDQRGRIGSQWHQF